jgi:succinyl-diaminopimelate desuccinylase
MSLSQTVVDPIALAQALIRCPSVTPAEAGALDVIEAALAGLGFRCRRLRFGTSPAVDNLYARFGSHAPNFCFAGHVDVVPPGAFEAWSTDPFTPVISHGRLFGRGAADMKAAIACFVAAAATFLGDRTDGLEGSVSLLLTADEEGPAVDGTVKVLALLAGEGETLDACLVGEPTNTRVLGETVKVGRRGSLNAELIVTGTQGHAAYPQRADNPIPRLLRMLAALTSTPLDEGTAYFEPSTLTLTSIDVGNPVSNVIPAEARARFNIRFNDKHSADSLRTWLEMRLAEAEAGGYALATEASGEPFLSPPGRFSELVVAAVRRVTGRTPKLDTSGGTSDARFIKNYCPVVEFGMPGETAHKVDENVAVDDIVALTEVYRTILHAFFDRRAVCPV